MDIVKRTSRGDGGLFLSFLFPTGRSVRLCLGGVESGVKRREKERERIQNRTIPTRQMYIRARARDSLASLIGARTERERKKEKN